jgi:hypothetical protein
VVERWFAIVVSAVTLACVLLPLTWKAPRDSFPLSSYPMFARDRRSATLHAIYAVAVDADETRHWVPPALVANREVLQARAMLERASRGGRKSVQALCEAIAGRVAAAKGELAGAVEIRILRGRHDSIAYFENGALGPEKRLGECRVPRP